MGLFFGVPGLTFEVLRFTFGVLGLTIWGPGVNVWGPGGDFEALGVLGGAFWLQKSVLSMPVVAFGFILEVMLESFLVLFGPIGMIFR